MIETIETKSLGEVINVSKLMTVLGTWSRSEAKRLISQDAVEIDGEKVGDTATIWDGSVLHVGKKFWCKLELPERTMTIEKSDNQVKILAIDCESLT